MSQILCPWNKQWKPLQKNLCFRKVKLTFRDYSPMQMHDHWSTSNKLCALFETSAPGYLFQNKSALFRHHWPRKWSQAFLTVVFWSGSVPRTKVLSPRPKISHLSWEYFCVIKIPTTCANRTLPSSWPHCKGLKLLVYQSQSSSVGNGYITYATYPLPSLKALTASWG